MLLYGSISTGSPASDSFGHQFSIKAFWDVLADPNVIRAFHNTLVVCFGGTVLAVFFGLFFSWVTARTNTPLRRTIEAVSIMPLLIPPLVAGIAWSILGSPRTGIINVFLGMLGLDLQLNFYSSWGIIVIFGIYYAPYVYMFTSSALKRSEERRVGKECVSTCRSR